MVDLNKAKGIFYGSVLGDVLGVPYEFKSRTEMENLTVGFNGPLNKSHPGVPPGAWSDDTSLMLCVSEAVLNNEQFDQTFNKEALEWFHHGKHTSNGVVFDVGGQTLRAIKNGFNIKTDEDAQGNGALMRTSPCAFIGDIDDAILLASVHTVSTHKNAVCVTGSIFLTTILHGMIRGESLDTALSAVVEVLRESNLSGSLKEFLDHGAVGNMTGSGWVVDCLNTSIACVQNTDSFFSAISAAVKLGNDTDTTACVTGAIAGALYGFEGVMEPFTKHVIGIERIDNTWSRLEKFIINEDSKV